MFEILDIIGMILIIILVILGLFIFGIIAYRTINELLDELREEREVKKNGK